MFTKSGNPALNNSSSASRIVSSSRNLNIQIHTLVIQGSDRITKLKEKIEGMQITIEKEKTSQLEQINKRLESLDEKLKNTVDTRNSALGAMSSNVAFKSKV